MDEQQQAPWRAEAPGRGASRAGAPVAGPGAGPVGPHVPPVPHGYPVLVVPARPTSGLAVAGFVLSLLWISPVALVLCLVALKRTSRGEQGGHGLAVAGVVIGGLGSLVWLAGIVQAVAVGVAGIALLGTAGAAGA